MSTERTKRFRAKLKEEGNEHLLAEHKRKERINRVKFYQKKKKDPEYRKKHNEAERLRYQKKVQAQLEASFSNEDIFKSTKSLDRAVNKVIKSLPQSKLKATAILQKIGKKLDISLTASPKKRVRTTSKKTKQVLEFYELDEISRQLTGKKNCMTIRNNEGSHSIQKREMLLTLEDAHKKFKEKFPDISVSLSHFKKLRPKHVNTIPKTRKNECGC